MLIKVEDPEASSQIRKRQLFDFSSVNIDPADIAQGGRLQSGNSDLHFRPFSKRLPLLAHGGADQAAVSERRGSTQLGRTK